VSERLRCSIQDQSLIGLKSAGAITVIQQAQLGPSVYEIRPFHSKPPSQGQ